MNKLLSLLFLTFITFQIHAYITLSNYLSLVGEKNLSIQIQKQELVANQYDYYKSYSSFLPSASFQWSWIRSEQLENAEQLQAQSLEQARLVDPQAEITGPEKHNPYWMRKFQAQLPVFLGGSRFISTSMSAHEKKIAELDLEHEKQNQYAQAVAAFFQAYMSQENLRLAKKGVELAQYSFDQSSIMLSSGRATELVHLNFSLSLEQRKQTMTQHEMNFFRDFSNMKRIAAQDLAQEKLIFDYDINSLVDRFKGSEPEELTAQLSSAMLANSPVLKKVTTLAELSSDMTWLSLSAMLPSVALSYEHDFGDAQSPFSRVFGEDDNIYMINFSFNIFNGFADALSYKSAAAREKKTMLMAIDTRSGQFHALRSIVSAILSSVRQRDVAVMARDISMKTMEQTRMEFKEGKATYLDLLSAENNYLSSEKNLIYIEGSLVSSYFQLQLILGKEITQ